MPARIDIESLTDQRQIEAIMTTLDENTLCELAAHIEDI